MVRLLSPLQAVVVTLSACICACSGKGSPAPGSGSSSGGDGEVDAGVAPEGGVGGASQACVGLVTASPPDTNKCTGDPSTCLSGSAQKVGFAAPMKQACASIYDTFPEGAVEAIQPQQLVAADGTWAFSGLDTKPWAHYYVRVVGAFELPNGAGWSAVPVVVGPLAVPASSTAVAARIQPVQLSLVEEKVPGQPLVVEQVSAQVFDPATAAKAEGTAQVAIKVGGATTPLQWGHDTAGQTSYFLQFAQPPAAQSSYEITTVLDDTTMTWHLQSTPATFDAAITAPSDGTTVDAGQDLVVTWPAQPAADFDLVELFARQGNAWAISQVSLPLRSDATGTQMHVGDAGAYLLNVLLAKAGCAPTADGCVFSESAASAQLTAR